MWQEVLQEKPHWNYDSFDYIALSGFIYWYRMTNAVRMGTLSGDIRLYAETANDFKYRCSLRRIPAEVMRLAVEWADKNPNAIVADFFQTMLA